MEQGLILYGREHAWEAGSSSWRALPTPPIILCPPWHGCGSVLEAASAATQLGTRWLPSPPCPGALAETPNTARLPKLHPARRSAGHEGRAARRARRLPCPSTGEVAHGHGAAAPLPRTSNRLRATDHTTAPQRVPGVTHAGAAWIERFYQVYSFKKRIQKKLLFFFFHMYITKKKKICNWDFHPGVTELIIKKKEGAGKPGSHTNWRGKPRETSQGQREGSESVPGCAGTGRSGLRPPPQQQPPARCTAHTRPQSPAASACSAGASKAIEPTAFCSRGWGFFFSFFLSRVSLLKLLWSEAGNPPAP